MEEKIVKFETELMRFLFQIHPPIARWTLNLMKIISEELYTEVEKGLKNTSSSFIA